MVKPSIWQNIYLNYFDEDCYETKNINELLIAIDLKIVVKILYFNIKCFQNI